MATYEAWNSAIASYFTAGIPRGGHVFLSLDDDAVEDIASRFIDEELDIEPIEDFITAIRKNCINPYREEIALQNIRDRIGVYPGGVAFLGIMVLAAHRMQEDEGIDESNYFLRLRETMRLSVRQGRPAGMPPGSEEFLWIAWNKFLVKNGFQTTAEQGSGPQKYLRYVLSQAILRNADKQFLKQKYKAANLPLTFDCDQLGFWLTRQHITRKHLSEGIHHPDPARAWEFYRAAHREYEASDWVYSDAQPSSLRLRLQNIECGIYRTESLLGDAQYLLFPKLPGRLRQGQLFILMPDSRQVELRPLRAGFFRPLWQQEPFVSEAIEYDISGDPHIKKLLFPKRDFWILTTDPENHQGALATWKPYLELGEKMSVLCRKGPFVAEMLRFRETKLIDWFNYVEHDGWAEFHGCMVLSYDWGSFITTPECRALTDALTPHAVASVALSGGLRDPNQNAWLEGFPPSLKVYGFDNSFEVALTASNGQRIFHEDVKRQQEIQLTDSLEPDSYQVEVKWNGKRVAVRIFRIISWDKIQEHPSPENLVNSNPASTGGLTLRGAIINEGVTEGREV